MNFNEKELEELVSRILVEVKQKLEYAQEDDEHVSGTVAVMTSFIPSKHACSRKLVEMFGAGIECALIDNVSFSAPGFFTFNVSTEAEKDSLMDKLAGAADIVLVTPKLSLIYKLAQGNDEGFVEQAFLRPLLWGRRVSMLLDFDIPRFKRATFFERLVDSIDALTRMGVRVTSYRPSAEENVERKALVTETDILDAYNSGLGRIICEPGAIITPLARDKAAELNVAVDW